MARTIVGFSAPASLAGTVRLWQMSSRTWAVTHIAVADRNHQHFLEPLSVLESVASALPNIGNGHSSWRRKSLEAPCWTQPCTAFLQHATWLFGHRCCTLVHVPRTGQTCVAMDIHTDQPSNNALSNYLQVSGNFTAESCSTRALSTLVNWSLCCISGRRPWMLLRKKQPMSPKRQHGECGCTKHSLCDGLCHS